LARAQPPQLPAQPAQPLLKGTDGEAKLAGQVLHRGIASVEPPEDDAIDPCAARATKPAFNADDVLATTASRVRAPTTRIAARCFLALELAKLFRIPSRQNSGNE
jgi:hypothetical protein